MIQYIKRKNLNIEKYDACIENSVQSRIYAFLKQEAIKNEAVAKMTIKLIKSVLGTKTKIDNSNNIDLLLEIMDAFPNLENPLIIKTI